MFWILKSFVCKIDLLPYSTPPVVQMGQINSFVKGIKFHYIFGHLINSKDFSYHLLPNRYISQFVWNTVYFNAKKDIEKIKSPFN